MQNVRILGVILSLMAALLPVSNPGTAFSSESKADPLYGTWEWVSSFGPWFPNPTTPVTTGVRRFLALDSTGSYEVWETHATGHYRVEQASFSVSPPAKHCGSACEGYLDLAGRRSATRRNRMSSFIFWFQGPDTLCLYPGGPDFFVSDDFTETYRRLSEPLSQFQERTDLPIRPAKAIAPVFEEMPIGRQIRLSTVMDRALHRAFIQYLPITSKQVGALEPKYRSDSRQSPLGVIGDLDGDGFEDAAIYRQVGGEHRVIWVLTAGDSIGVTSISLPGPPAVFGETPTTSYLKYVPPGTAIKEAGGGVVRLKWAAIELISKQGGNSRIFYVDGQKIRIGARL